MYMYTYINKKVYIRNSRCTQRTFSYCIGCESKHVCFSKVILWGLKLSENDVKYRGFFDRQPPCQDRPRSSSRRRRMRRRRRTPSQQQLRSTFSGLLQSISRLGPLPPNSDVLSVRPSVSSCPSRRRRRRPLSVRPPRRPSWYPRPSCPSRRSSLRRRHSFSVRQSRRPPELLLT